MTKLRRGINELQLYLLTVLTTDMDEERLTGSKQKVKRQERVSNNVNMALVFLYLRAFNALPCGE